MNTVVQIDCPPEVLISLHSSAKNFAELMKMQTAIFLFKEGKMSSGTAASWLNMERVQFLYKAMDAGAVLLDDDEDDFQREISLL